VKKIFNGLQLIIYNLISTFLGFVSILKLVLLCFCFRRPFFSWIRSFPFILFLFIRRIEFITPGLAIGTC